MNTCIYSFEEFETAHGEHVLQNSLGARLTSENIVCDDVQQTFGSSIDVALAKAYEPIRNFLKIRTGRGRAAPMLRRLLSDKGQVFDLQPEASRLAEPIVSLHKQPDGRRVAKLLLDHRGQLSWALSKVRREVPDLSADEESLWHSRQTVRLPESTVQVTSYIGGQDYFRGMLKSCFNLLALDHREIVLQPSFDAVRHFVMNGSGGFGRFIKWSTNTERLDIPALGPIDHAILVVSRGSSVEGIVQFFGEILHPFQLTNDYFGEPIHCGYVVNPFRDSDPAEIRTNLFADSVVPLFSKQQSHITSEVIAVLEERLARLAKFMSFNKAFDKAFKETWEDILGNHEGQILTQEILDQFVNRLLERAAQFLF